MRFFKLFVVGLILVGMSACTHRLVDFTIISSKNVDLSKAATFKRGNQRVEGVDKAYIIIFIPTGFPEVKQAVDNAIEKVPGCVALVDGVISQTAWYFLIGYNGINVEGTPLIDPSLAMYEGGLKSNYMIAEMNEKGEVASFKYVTKDEYQQYKDSH